MGSFSKIFAPSVRLGWIQADEKYISELSNSGHLDSSGCVNPLGCTIVHELLKYNLLEPIVYKWRSFLSMNCKALYDTLENGKYV